MMEFAGFCLVGGCGRLSAVPGKINKFQGRTWEEARSELPMTWAVLSVQAKAGP